MSSGTPPDSLRSVDLKRPKLPILRILLFAPLALLLLLVLLLALLGVGTKLEARQEAADQRATILANGNQRDSLPGSCLAPSFEPLPADIWTAPRAAGSDETFARHPEAAGMRVEGRNGFNFWGDQQAANFSQALGRAPWLDDQLAQWLAYFQGLDAELDAQGQELLVVVAPAKWQLYRENLPEWTDDLQGKTHMDQFLERSGGIPIADVRDALLAAKDRAPVYSAVNSHWSPFGALEGWRQAVECGAELYPDSVLADVTVPVTESVEVQQAPNEFAPFGDTSSPNDWTIPVYTQLADSVNSTITDANGAEQKGSPDGFVGLLDMPARTSSSGGVGSALILRDSTGEALSSPWSNAFATTCQIRHNLDQPELRPDVVAEARNCNADVVLFVFTERYFASAPPSL